jgi:integrase
VFSQRASKVRFLAYVKLSLIRSRFVTKVVTMSQKQYFFNAIGVAGLKHSTGETYWVHVDHFIDYLKTDHGTDRPSKVGLPEIEGYLKHLYTTHQLSAKSRNQAIAALKFLYGKILKRPLDDDAVRPLRAKQSPFTRKTLISKPDIGRLFQALPNPHKLLFSLCYAGAMRLSDAIQLRVKDVSFDQESITICDCKHDHFRSVPLPRSLHDSVKRQIDSVRVLHGHDATDNSNGVPLPDARVRKAPSDARSISWYWLFPSGSLSRDPQTGFFGRWHMDADHSRKVFKQAIAKAGIDRRITPHDLRRTAATRMHFEMGMPLVRLQVILGHNSLDQTREYILEDEININGSMSPFDALGLTG